MSNLVIVAIPDENDRVWKISSEKVPHCTLLFLGEADEVSNLQSIVQFVEHAANTTLHRFHLPVDRRGKLGDDDADVLFFKKGRYDYKAVHDFRHHLLQDDNIRTAYDEAEQRDMWLPHLTLGYPGSPAKPDEDDYGFYDVGFNKIAVWPEEYDGPEFLLKDWWDEWDAMATAPLDVAMGDVKISSVQEARAALGLKTDTEIEHYGVKGMKWGVRKAAEGAKATGGGIAKATKATNRFVQDVHFESRIESGKAREMVISAAHKPFKNEDLPAIKARHGDYAKLTNRVKKPFSTEAKAYRKDARETYVKRLEATANSMKNASGDRQYTIRERGIDQPAAGGNLPKSKTFWDVSSRRVEHADAEDFTRLELVFDDEGYISELKPVEVDDALSQTEELGAEFLVHLGLMTEAEFIEHYGVKGMRWGVRNVKSGAKAVGRAVDNTAFALGTSNATVQRNITDQAHKTMKKEDLPAIKTKHGSHGKARVRIATPLSKESRAYRADVKAAYLKRLEEAANTRTNFQGNRRYTLKEDGKPNTKKYFWTLKVEKIDKVKHADDDVDLLGVEFKVHPVMDAEGWIVDFEPVDEEMAQSEIDLAEEFMLEHFGVKGMKWGVRKAREAGQAVGRGFKAVGRALEAMGADLADSSWQSSTYSDVKHEAVHNHVAKELDNRVERLAKSPKYRGKDLKADRDLRHEYRQDVAKVSSAAYRRGVKEVYGENYTGTKTAHYVTDPRGPRIEVRDKATGKPVSEAELTSQKEIRKRRKAEAEEAAKAFHAATTTDFPDLVIKLTQDANEQITGVGFIKPSGTDMAQSVDLSSIKLSDIGNDGAFIEHFGVKGMRWGIRKEPPTAVAPSAASKVPHGDKRKTKVEVQGGQNHPAHGDALKVAEARVKLKKSGTAALSNQELRDVANRLQLENQVALLTSSRGKTFVSKELEREGQQLVKRHGRKGVKRAAKVAGTVAIGALV